MQDPRFITFYAADYKGQPYFGGGRTIVPDYAVEQNCCMPGYQPTRPDKGWKLSVTDYPFHNIQMQNGLWPEFTPSRDGGRRVTGGDWQ